MTSGYSALLIKLMLKTGAQHRGCCSEYEADITLLRSGVYHASWGHNIYDYKVPGNPSGIFWSPHHMSLGVLCFDPQSLTVLSWLGFPYPGWQFVAFCLRVFLEVRVILSASEQSAEVLVISKPQGNYMSLKGQELVDRWPSLYPEGILVQFTGGSNRPRQWLW